MTTRQVQTRARTTTATQSAPKQANSPYITDPKEGFSRGRSIVEQQKAQRERKLPSRFKVPVGETREILVLDDKPTFWAEEWTIFDKYTRKQAYEVAISAQTGPDPFEQMSQRNVGESAQYQMRKHYNMYLTVLDLTPFTYEGKEYKYSKRLLVIRASDLGTFENLLDTHGSLRGLHLEMSRTDDKKPGYGDKIFPVTIEETLANGKKVQAVVPWSEAELLESFGHPERRSEDGQKLYKAANEDIQPFDYRKLFPEPDPMDQAVRWGIDYRPIGNVAQETKTIQRNIAQHEESATTAPTPAAQEGGVASSRRARVAPAPEQEATTAPVRATKPAQTKLEEELDDSIPPFDADGQIDDEEENY